MDIEKIKNYNQKMLAVITTAAVAFAVIGLFSFIFFLFTEVFRVFDRSSVNYQEEGLSVEDPYYGEPEDKMPELYVSYRFPHLVDTTRQIFVIPVTHQTKDELRDDFSRKLSFSGSESYNEYNYSNSSTFVNLLIYNAITGQNEKVFKQKIIIGEYRPMYFGDDILLVFEATDKDSDNNGVMNLNDNTSLFIYSINSRILKQAKMEGKTIINSQFIGKTKDLIIRFGTNPNLRTKTDKEFDAGILCKYSYEKDQLITINDDKLNAELKKIAEGEDN